MNIKNLYAVVPAAGNGSRMGAGHHSKVLLRLGSCSILELTLKALIATELFAGIVLALRRDDEEQIDAVIERLTRGEGVQPELRKVWGGETRQASVYNCLSALRGRAEWVAVHDAARPLCLPQEISAGIQVCLATKAAILASPVSSTVKRSGPDGEILQTVPRSDLWLAQTPQFFAFDLLWQAHEQARAEGYLGTDESELVERTGAKVSLVRASDSNIKITTPDDIDLALSLLKLRGE